MFNCHATPTSPRQNPYASSTLIVTLLVYHILVLNPFILTLTLLRLLMPISSLPFVTLIFGCYSLLCDETLRFQWKLGVSFTCRNIQPSDFWSWSVASGLMRVACSCRWCLVFRWVRSFRTFRLFLLVIHHSFLALNANTHPPCALVKHWPFFRQRGLEFPQFQLFTILAKYLPPRSTIAGLTGVLF